MLVGFMKGKLLEPAPLLAFHTQRTKVNFLVSMFSCVFPSNVFMPSYLAVTADGEVVLSSWSWLSDYHSDISRNKNGPPVEENVRVAPRANSEGNSCICYAT